jgi:hypothetical protein
MNGSLKISQLLRGNKLAKLTTSISDNGTYPDFCAKASIDTNLFINFRRNKFYGKILEHITKELGESYISETKRNDNSFFKNVDFFKQNDIWGNPELFNFPEIGQISTTTLRYIKVLSDLLKYFRNLNDLSICEIGVGYGGQCRITNSISSPKEYTLVDIKPALMLCQRYLDNYILNSRLKYTTMNELETKEYDLVISNYAFTELTREIQDVYLKKIILNSKRGYITYNEISPEDFRSYKREELLKIIPNSKIIEEVPLTHPKNCIIIWGDL